MTISGSGAGRVRSTGGEIDCLTSCAPLIAEGAHLSLAAQPASGSAFGGWDGACSGTASCEIVVAPGISVTARFAVLPPLPPNHIVHVQVVGGGLVQSNPNGIWCPTICSGTFATGKAVKLDAWSFTDWRFVGWSGACSGAACTVDMTADASVIATFEQIAVGECAGLTPLDPGTARIVSVPLDPNVDAPCFRGVVDGSGTLSVGHRNLDIHSTGHFLFFAPDGSLHSTQDYVGLHSLAPQQAGFLGVAEESPGYAVYSLASDGSELNHVGGMTGTGMNAADPGGGGVVVTSDSIESFDATAHLRWSVSIADITEQRYAVGVDQTGQVLLLFDGRARFTNTAVGGVWITHEGQRGSIFSAIPFKYGDTWLVLLPRLDGGFWVEEFSPLGSHWLRQIESLGASSSPPPAWLHWTPRLIREGRAYALLPDEVGAYSPTCTLEVVTTSGKSCGAIYFDDPSGRCDSTAQMSVGREGTLVLSLRGPQGCKTNCACNWRVWSGYLR